MKKKIYSVLVENRSGVLAKVAGLFARRSYNIDSLAVGETEDPSMSRITIVTKGSDRTIEQISKQLNKKLDVIKVKTFDEDVSYSRELMLVKVKFNRSNRRELLETLQIYPKVEIKDQSKNMLLLQVCYTPEYTARFLEALKSFSVVEVARTGTLALKKCSEDN